MKLDLLLRDGLLVFPDFGCVPGSVGVRDGRIVAHVRAGRATSRRRRSSTAAEAGSCRASIDPARALRLRLAGDRLPDRVAIGRAGRRDVGALVLSHRRLPQRVRRIPRSRGVAKLHRLRPALRHHEPSARGNARRMLAAIRRHVVQALPHVQGRGRARAGIHRDRRRAAVRGLQGDRRDRRRGARHPLRERRGHSVPARAAAAAGRDDLRAWNEQSPDFLEAENVHRACYFAGKAGCRDQHRAPVEPRSARRSAPASAAHEAAPIYVETCPHYLFLDDASPAGVLAKVNPPIRGRADVDAMWEGIVDGSIDTVGTDHVPRKRSTKAGKGIWASSNGFPGVATMLPIMMQRGLSPPRHRAGADRGGARRATPRASTAWRTRARSRRATTRTSRSSIPELARTVEPATLESFADYSPYEGMTLKGWPVATLRARPQDHERRRDRRRAPASNRKAAISSAHMSMRTTNHASGTDS